MARVVIFGAETAARLALHCFATDSSHEVVGFTVDRPFMKGEEFQGLPLVPSEMVSRVFPPDRHCMFIALGYKQMNALRARKYDEAKRMGYCILSYVSSRSTYLSAFPPGENAFIQAGTLVEPFARIGNCVTLWSGSHVAHDAVVEDCCYLSPGAVVLGFSRIGAFSFVGGNATVRDGVVLAPRTLVGAGAVVQHDTQDGQVCVAPPSLKSNRKSVDIFL